MSKNSSFVHDIYGREDSSCPHWMQCFTFSSRNEIVGLDHLARSPVVSIELFNILLMKILTLLSTTSHQPLVNPPILMLNNNWGSNWISDTNWGSLSESSPLWYLESVQTKLYIRLTIIVLINLSYSVVCPLWVYIV